MWNGDKGSLVGRSWTGCNLDQGEWECLERNRKHSNSFIRRNSTLRGRESQQVRISEILIGRQRPYYGKFVHQLSFQVSSFKLQHMFVFFYSKSEDGMYGGAHTPMKPNLEEILAKNGRKTFKAKCFFQRLSNFEWNSRGQGILYINGIFTIVKPCWKEKEPASRCRKVCISSKWMRAAMCNVWDKTRSTCWQVVQARKGAKSRANRTQSLIPAAGLGGCNERCPSVRWLSAHSIHSLKRALGPEVSKHANNLNRNNDTQPAILKVP